MTPTSQPSPLERLHTLAELNHVTLRQVQDTWFYTRPFDTGTYGPYDSEQSALRAALGTDGLPLDPALRRRGRVQTPSGEVWNVEHDRDRALHFSGGDLLPGWTIQAHAQERFDRLGAAIQDLLTQGLGHKGVAQALLAGAHEIAARRYNTWSRRQSAERRCGLFSVDKVPY